MTSYAFNEYALPLLITGLAVLFLGALTLAQERGSRVAGPYVLMSLTLAVWSLAMGAMYLSADAAVAATWARVGHVGLLFFPTVAYQFTRRVLDRRGHDPVLLGGIVSSLLLLIPVVSGTALLREPQLYAWGWYFRYGPLGGVFIAYFVLMLGANVLRYALALRATKPGSGMHHRAGMLLAGLAVGCLCTIDLFAAYNVPVPPLGYLAIAGLYSITTYVTWRYRFVDINPSLVGRQVLETMADALLVLDTNAIVRLANPAACELLGRRRDELLGAHASSCLDPGLLADTLAALRRGDKVQDVEASHTLADGARRTLSVSANAMYDSNDVPSAFVYVLADITSRKEAEERIRFLAYFDNLTDLPNRAQFNEQLGRTLADAAANNRKLAMFFLDLDRFKRINDTLGHGAGDQLLQAVAERIRNCVRHCDFLTARSGRESQSIIARLGGDEFIVVLSDIVRAEDSAIVARRILDVLAEPFGIDNHEVFVSASVGISLYPRDGHDAQALLKNADTAMYHAKDAGRNNYQFYQPSMNAATMERLALESDLRKALERGELELYYQPQVNYRTGKVIGSEALLRWRHPVRGLMAPADFVHLAEEAGLLAPIGEWVLRTACSQTYLWQQSGYGPMHIAVNLSERQFRQHNLVETVAKALNESGLAPRALDLELTENIIMDHSPETLKTLYELKAMGIKISVDDFGTGYSSLGYLKRFPVDLIKIDHTFVRDLATSPDDAAITTAIIAMARSLKLEVLAEGVETPAQAEFLIDHGCALMQGYMFGRPLPAPKFERLLKPATHLHATPAAVVTLR
jgi:diguanylate cyclase (GGDEF)-like protein/PAS domain S-box-containing protein